MTHPLDDKIDRESRAFAEDPWEVGLKWLLRFVVIVVLIYLVVSALGWVFGWGNEAKRITGVSNVKEQNTKIIDDWTQMTVAAQNACDAKDAPSTSSDPTMLEDPSLAYKATYRRISADYDRRMSNLFEAEEVRKLSLPDDLHKYPKEAPSLSDREAQVC